MSELYQRSFIKLELDQILEQLAQCAGSEEGKEACRRLCPVTDLEEVQKLLAETTAASDLCTRKGNPSFSGVTDISLALDRADRGGTLQMQELLRIGGVLRCTRSMKSYLDEDDKKTVLVEYLYLDLKTCDRCVGTDKVLEEVLEVLTPVLELAGYDVKYHKKEMTTINDAKEHKFVSSPTIRVNGNDICDSVIENDCGCCGEISGTQVDCRVFEYEGNQYEVPPKAMLTEYILRAVFSENKKSSCVEYELPDNLKRFYEGKTSKSSCCCNGGCC